MIHTHHTYKSSLQSSPLYSQPLQKFWLLHATVTYAEGQDHWKGINLLSHVKSDRNLYLNILKQAKFGVCLSELLSSWTTMMSKNKKSKWSNNPLLPYLKDFFAVISLP